MSHDDEDDSLGLFQHHRDSLKLGITRKQVLVMNGEAGEDDEVEEEEERKEEAEVKEKISVEDAKEESKVEAEFEKRMAPLNNYDDDGLNQK